MNTKKLSILIVSIMTLALANLAAADGGTPNPARKAAFQSCAAKNDVTLPIQGPLSPATREAMQECMRDAGFSFGGHYHHHHHWKAIRACVANAGVQLPAFVPGQKPTLTAQQKGAIQTCREQLKAQHQAATGSTQ